jgi:hypothetical protein
VRGERSMGAGGLRTCTSKHFSFFSNLSSFSSKYIILVNHFFFFIYSCKTPTVITDAAGISYPTLCAVARIHEPPRNQRIYNISFAYRCISFHVFFRSLLCCVTLCPCTFIYSISLPFYNHPDFRISM